MAGLFAEMGERIRRAREDRGWTQAQLGEAIGYSQAAIGNYESGRRHLGLDDLYRIADALGKPYSYFIGADKQLEEQVKRDVEHRVRRDVAGFVGVRMLPVLQKAVPVNVPLPPDHITCTVPVPREFGERADIIVQVQCGGLSLHKGAYVFVRREEAQRPGEVVLVDAGGRLDLATCSQAGGYLWTGSGEPVGPAVAVIGVFCGVYTETGTGGCLGKARKGGPGWEDLMPAEREQVEQFVEFLRSKRALE